MNIAVITFSDFNTNYGSMLQAFSMKKYLEEIGHSVTFIRYREFNRPNSERFDKKMSGCVRKLAINSYKLVKHKDIARTHRNFEVFKDDYFQYTPLYTSSDDMREKMQKFDCYICGSDQIWNLSCLGGLRTPYFLDFAPSEAIKFSYAASMGDYHVESCIQNRFSELLNGLDYISIREADRIDELQNLTDKKVVSVVDPVFLNSKEQWQNWIPDSPIKGDYAVCYFVRRSRFGRKIVETMADEYRMPIYNLSDNMIYLPKTSSKYISAGPLEFLSILRGAKYAVGTSFHLAAFSIIFDIPILTIGMESNRSRIQNILEMAGIKDHFIVENGDYMKIVSSFMGDKMDKTRLLSEISQSKDYINIALAIESV